MRTLALCLLVATRVHAFVLVPGGSSSRSSAWAVRMAAASDGGSSDEAKADDLAAKAAALREEVSALEEEMKPVWEEQRKQREAEAEAEAAKAGGGDETGGPTLDGRTVLVVGANGVFGSKVVRKLLREHKGVSVRAMVTDVDKLESFGRLSYESGAEDGQGTISPVWMDRTISFEFTPEMAGAWGRGGGGVGGVGVRRGGRVAAVAGWRQGRLGRSMQLPPTSSATAFTSDSPSVSRVSQATGWTVCRSCRAT